MILASVVPPGDVLVYALGGGLGHLARARRVVGTLGVADRATLLSASLHAGDRRVTGGLPVIHVDPAFARDPSAVRALIEGLAPTTLVVDAFPLGILGELDGLRGPGVVHVARRLRWDAYRQRIGPGRIRFARTLVLEPLEPDHDAFLRDRSDEMVPFAPDPDPAVTPHADPALARGPGAPAAAPPQAADGGASRPGTPQAPDGGASPSETPRAHPDPHWLVVHGGPDAETLELVEHARERQRAERVTAPIVLVAPVRPADLRGDVLWRDEHPAAPFLAAADRVVTAGGWNLVDEARGLGARHHVVPFPRALDDQAWRAARARREHGAR